MMACPNRDQLELLLAKRLAETAREELEMHVENCEACQQVLELLTEFTDWEPTRKRGGDPSHARNRAGELAVAAVGLQSLGGYRVGHELGRGGMGVVYEAEHESLKNRVALKVMHARFRDDQTYVRRFRIEARAAAKLHHTNIVPVFDYGEQDGVCYYAMQCIDGVSLERVLEDVRRLRAAADCGGEARTGVAGKETATDGGADPPTAISRGLLSGRFEAAPTGSFVAGSNSTTTAAIDRATTGVKAGVDGSASASSGGGAGSGSSSLGGQPESVYFREVARFGAQVADALDYAHRQRVIHRDIKPSNLMLDTHGNIWVSDFGLAKLLEGDDLSQSHDLVGTMRFMAPERFRGITDPSGDVYALGATLYELLCLKPAFAERDHARLIDQITHEAPAPLRQHDRRIPRDLETIVLKTLAKDPADRCGTAGELRDELLRVLEGRPTRWRRVGPVEQFRRWCKRNPVVAGAVGAVAAALVVTTVVAVLYADRQRYFATAQKKAYDEITRLAARADEQRRKADQARADAVADSYRALVGETQALRLARPTGWRGTALGNLRRLAGMDTPQRDLVTLRSEAVACLAELDVREVLRLEGQTQLVFGLDFSPDGKTLASADYYGHVFVWELSEGRQLRQITDPAASATDWWNDSAPLPFVRFRPGGAYLAYTTWGRSVEFLGWKDQKSTLPLRHNAQPRAIAFDRKGELLGISWGDGHVGLYEAATGAERRLVATRAPVTEGFYMPLALSPDGDLLATRGPGHAVQLYTVATVGEPRVLGRHAAVVRSLAFGPDGKRLVSASEDRTAKLWDVHSGKEVLSFQGHTSSLTSVAFSPDGELVATSSDDQTLRLWAARSGQPLQSVHPGGTPVVVAFGPDSHRLAAGCATSVVVYELAERLGRQVPGYREFTMAIAVHPRKPLLASASRRCLVSLEDVVTGEELRTWQFAAMLGRLAFSPDGRMLAVGAFALNPTYQLMGNKDVYLVDTENGKTRKLVLGDVSEAVAFDPAGRLLAVGHQSGAVTVCNAESGATVHRCQSTNGWISEVAFCRGGQLLVGEVGGSLRLCDMVDGRTIREVRLPRGLFRFVVDPAERQVAAVDLFGTVRVFKFPDLQQVGTIDRSDAAGQVGLGFSGDGRWLAIGGSDRRVSVYDARTLRRMIQLPTQNGVVYDVALQRHGSGLAHGGADETLSFWDLSQIELALAANGLGWEGAPPDGVPSTSQIGPAPRLRMERGWGKREDINWYLQQVLKTNPDQADLLMELAWVQVMGPTKLRNATEALPLARRAVELAPDEPLCLNTLGVVYYRLGQWKEAADTLQASAQNNPEGPAAYDLFFLAMAYRHTGQPAKAKDCYDRAVRWCRAHGKLAHYQLAELLAIRAEAEGLLGPLAGERPAAEQAASRTDNSPSLPAGGADTTVATTLELGGAYVAGGRAREAIPHLAKAFAANPNDTLLSVKVAALQAWFGQEKELAATRQRVLAFAKDTNDANTAERAAKVCSILPYTDKVQLEAALALARKGVELGKGGEWGEWRLLALGMAEYRSGNDGAAQQALLAAVAAAGENNLYVTGTSAFFRAMTLFRQGKPDEARRVAIAAAAKMKPLPKDENNPLAGGVSARDYEDDLILWLAYKEAKVLIRFDADTRPKAETFGRAQGGGLVIERPREGATVGMREDLTGRIESEGWPVIFVQAGIPGQPWWSQAHVTKIDGGKFTTKVVFGDEFTPSGTKFRIAGIVARTREEALKFDVGSQEPALPEGSPQSDVVVVTHQ